MKIQWQQELATGNHEIDNHHQEMLQKIDELILACKENREKTAVIKMLAFLNRHVNSHFALEEKFIVQHNCPNACEHLKQHRELLNNLDILTAECSQEGVTLSVTTNSLKLTYLWLKDHIQLMDKSMVLAMKSCTP